MTLSQDEPIGYTDLKFCDSVLASRDEEFCFSLVRNRRFLIVFIRQKRSKPLRGNRRFVRYFVVIFM